MILFLSTGSSEISPEVWSDHRDGVTVFAVPGDVKYAKKHGVYKIDSKTKRVTNMFYCGREEDVASTVMQTTSEVGSHSFSCLNAIHSIIPGTFFCAEKSSAKPKIILFQVPLVAGVIFMCPQTVEKLLSLLVTPPLNACTYLGLDDGAEMFTLSLFIDIIQCMATGFSSLSEAAESPRSRARAVIGERFCGTQIKAICLVGAHFVYMPSSFLEHAQHIYSASPLRERDTLQCKLFEHSHKLERKSTNKWSSRTRVYVEGEIHDDAVVINSTIGPSCKIDAGSVISHSMLTGSELFYRFDSSLCILQTWYILV